MSQKTKHLYAFGPFLLDASECLLTLQGKPIPLAPKAFEVLVILVENAGHLIDKDDLMQRLWPDSFVEEGNVAKHVSLLRKVLSEATNGREYIETVPKRGYRFVVDVREVADAEVDSEHETLSGASQIVENADLESLRRDLKPAKRQFPHWRELAVGAVAALLVAGATLWFSRGSSSGRLPREPKLRELTNSSFEKRVLFGAISPDGKYLAYSDAEGIRVKLVATGETLVIPQPEELNGEQVDLEVVATWFPDSTRFIANAHQSGALEGIDRGEWASPNSSIWEISVLGGPPHKLRDNAVAYSISPDGSLVSFGTNKGSHGDREIWLMTSSGEEARKLFDTDEESSIWGLIWSPDGKRVLYVKTDSEDTLVTRDLQGGPPSTILGPGDMKRVNDFSWLTDGRLLYSLSETDSFFGSACNFWEMRLDSRTGTPVTKPRQLTNWSGFCMTDVSVTADGKKLAFLKWSGNLTSFLAELAPDGTRLLNRKHFPLSESSEGVVDWTPDSKAILFVSNRSGHMALFRQPLDQDIAEPVVPEGYGRDPRVTPDGKNIVYLGIGNGGPPPVTAPEPVMRVSLTGGPSERLFTARPSSQMTCAKFSSGPCIIGEPTDDGTKLVVSTLDPIKGRAAELFRFPLVASAGDWFMDLSPDGTRLAATQSPAGPIYILSLGGQVLQKVQVKGWSDVQSFYWTADEKGFFVAVRIRNGREILHVDLHGNARALWENAGGAGETLAHPSPDGRHLAIDGWTKSANMWIMENF
jgi:DNA-binding winged helix-turn-helix (wHTH) protein/Tol biopolymer transport system component